MRAPYGVIIKVCVVIVVRSFIGQSRELEISRNGDITHANTGPKDYLKLCTTVESMAVCARCAPLGGEGGETNMIFVENSVSEVPWKQCTYLGTECL